MRKKSFNQREAEKRHLADREQNAILQQGIQLFQYSAKALDSSNMSDFLKRNEDFYNWTVANENLVPKLKKSLSYISSRAAQHLSLMEQVITVYEQATAFRDDIEKAMVLKLKTELKSFVACQSQLNEQSELKPFHESEIAIKIWEHLSHKASMGFQNTYSTSVSHLFHSKLNAVRAIGNVTLNELNKIYGLKEESQIWNIVRASREKENKWASLVKTQNSILNVNSPNQKSANIQADLQRSYDVLVIDGQPLGRIALYFNDFKTEDDIQNFFNSVLLKEFKGTKQERESAINYLNRTFHQGGLMRPVSSALTTQCLIKNDEGDDLGSLKHPVYIQVQITTTSSGFIIKERCVAKELMVLDLDWDGYKFYATDLNVPIIFPMNGQDSLIKAEATIQIDFAKKDQQPALVVLNNKMEINHPLLTKYLDKRSLGQRIIDFLKHLFSSTLIKNSVAENPEDMNVNGLRF